MTLIVGRPSKLPLALRHGVQSGRIQRGHGWLLHHVPCWFWGGQSILMPTAIGDLVLSVGDSGSLGILLYGQIMHERHETALVQSLASSCQVMLDIGANYGWYSRLMWDAMQSKGRVYAFEPFPRVFEYLQANMQQRAGAFLFQMIVKDTNAPTTFYCADSSNLSSAVRPVGPPIVVKSQTLDAFCQDTGILGRVDFVKCDVEGGEVAVLRGAQRIRGNARAPIWMIEVDEQYLAEAGTSADEMMAEIHQPKADHLFYLDEAGLPQEIAHSKDRRGTSNLFIVPEARLAQFKLAAETVNGELARPSSLEIVP